MAKAVTMSWPIKKARQRFPALIRQALNEGPQVVTRRGEEVVVVISAHEYQRLVGNQRGFKAFLLAGPDFSTLDLQRSDELPREVDL
ncbi:MAG: type II toxin-antitoxin system Phd/YefM family antitoxin [Chloroflexi bacterium]|nr:type II toxin-antitoxin system Phd/YefM family antitoxin [Chloroflexota bacterium]